MLSILILMEYSIVVDFSKKIKKKYKMSFGKKGPQLTEEKSRMRTANS